MVESFAEHGFFLNEQVENYSSGGIRSRLTSTISMTIDFDCFLIDEAMLVGHYSFPKI